MANEPKVAHLLIGVEEHCNPFIELERGDRSLPSTLERMTAHRVLTSRDRQLKAIALFYGMKRIARVDKRDMEERSR